MEPLAVDLLLLRALETPELRISPGRALMARVVRADAATGRGALTIAGAMIEAKLPEHVTAGDNLRLIVREVGAERVVLTLSDQSPVAVAPATVPLPGGGHVQVTEREPGAPGVSGVVAHTVTVRYDAPALGPVDLRFRLDAGSLALAVTTVSGDPFERVQAAADELRAALSENLDRPVTVTVSARREPVDVYA